MTVSRANLDRDAVPAFIGHRGAAGHAPENTLASIRAAAAMGVRWVEFDTKLSRDGDVVLFHDDTLERTTDGRGAIAAANLTQLRALDAGSWFGPAFAGESVPTLTEALAVLEELGLGAVVEIKASPGLEAETGGVVAQMLANRWPAALPRPLISSFKIEALVAARDAVPELPRALNVLDVLPGWRDRLRAADCVALHCLHDRLGRRRVAAARDAGYAVRCFTVNRLKRAETLFNWGVETVITDFPDRMG